MNMGEDKGKGWEYVTNKMDGDSDSRNRQTTKNATDLLRKLVWLYTNLRSAKRIQALERLQQGGGGESGG